MSAMMGNAMKPLRHAPFARTALIAVATLGLSGCLSLGAKLPDQLFRLSPDESAPAGTTVSGPLAQAIVVLDPETDRSLDVMRVPVRIDEARVAYLKNAAWIERPARQFRSLLAETLRARTGRLVVEDGDYDIAGKSQVGGRLLEMGYDARKRAVVVRFDAVLRSAGGGEEIASRRFEAVISGLEPEAKDVGPALNRAANDVAGQVADWIKAPSA